jgi:hypothetical protein
MTAFPPRWDPETASNQWLQWGKKSRSECKAE